MAREINPDTIQSIHVRFSEAIPALDEVWADGSHAIGTAYRGQEGYLYTDDPATVAALQAALDGQGTEYTVTDGLAPFPGGPFPWGTG